MTDTEHRKSVWSHNPFGKPIILPEQERPIFLDTSGFDEDGLYVGIDITTEHTEHSIPLRVNGIDVMKELQELQEKVAAAEKEAPIKSDYVSYSRISYQRTELK